MKKLLAGAALILSPVITFAHPAGCGLGTHVIFNPPQNWAEHVLAFTTNGIASNTFGMTSGTMGCEDADGPLARRIGQFVDNNLDQLAMDSASGQGETLDALAELIGVDAADQALFSQRMKENFDAVFASEQSDSGDVYNALVDMMSHDAKLAKYLG